MIDQISECFDGNASHLPEKVVCGRLVIHPKIDQMVLKVDRLPFLDLFTKNKSDASTVVGNGHQRFLGLAALRKLMTVSNQFHGWMKHNLFLQFLGVPVSFPERNIFQKPEGKFGFCTSIHET